MFELFTVGKSLLSEDNEEDGKDDVLGNVFGILDDLVTEEEFHSDILETVGGEHEGNAVPFNDISNLDGGLVGVALVEHLLSFLNQSKDFDFSL